MITGLETLLPVTANTFLVLSRLLCCLLCLPGFGEHFFPMRMRFLTAFGMSLMLAPLLPPAGTDFSIEGLFLEAFVGLFMGSVVRLAVEGVVMLGGLLSHQFSFANVMSHALSFEIRDVFSVFMTLYFLVLFFRYDFHVHLIRGLVASYDLFPLHSPLFTRDAIQSIFQAFSEGFLLSVSMAAPFLVFGLFYYALLGVLNRLVPMLPVFFIGQPLALWVLLLLFLMCLPRFAVLFTDILNVWVARVLGA